MEYHRKQAKALVRGFRAGEADAVARARAVLGTRANERFLLSDAQHVIAREQGFRSWVDLKLGATATTWVEGEDVVVRTALTYGGLSRPIDVVVRKRGWRFDVSDGGNAVAAAGSPPGWQAIAEGVVEEHALNVNRRGVVFVQANESRLASLVDRVAECSLAVFEELLEHE